MRFLSIINNLAQWFHHKFPLMHQWMRYCKVGLIDGLVAIKHLTEHLKANHKDHRTARSLTMLVGKRRKMLKYLYVNDINRYRAIIKALGLRR